MALSLTAAAEDRFFKIGIGDYEVDGGSIGNLSNNSYSLAYGGGLSEKISVEGELTHFAQAELAVGDVSVDIATTTIGANLIIHSPKDNAAYFYFKLGVHHGYASASSSSISDTVDLGTDYASGIGAGFNIGKSGALQLDYSIYGDSSWSNIGVQWLWHMD